MHIGEYELLTRCFVHGMCDTGRSNDNRDTIGVHKNCETVNDLLYCKMIHE